MLKHIHVIPLAAESFGVRSMCTYVETPDIRALLDAGVSLCPRRFGLPPHPKEFQAIQECRKRIAAFADKAEIVAISHYHFDHHTPSFEDWVCNWTQADETARQIYAQKTVYLKNPREMINYSQRQRAWMFHQTGGKYARRIEVADGSSHVFGETRIRFSEPVFHGSEGSFLGWVLMTTVECQDEKLMFAPDVQGPISEKTFELIMAEKPRLLIVGGPPSYLVDFKVSGKEIQTGLDNLRKLVENVPSTVLEHHLLRDENWLGRAKCVFETAQKNSHKVMTAAELVGQQTQCLEAARKRLFIEEPPSKEFEKWMRLNDDSKSHTRPPV